VQRIWVKKYIKLSYYIVPGLCILIVMVTLTLNRTAVWNNSITLFSDVIQKQNKCSIAFNNRGEAYNASGKYELALTDLKEALALDPKNADILTNYAWSLCALGKNNESIPYLENALTINPNLPEAHNNLGNAYGMQGNYKNSLFHFFMASRQIPTNPTFIYNIGFTYQNMKNIPKAIEYYQKSAKMGSKQAQKLLIQNHVNW
ncbi:MAG TPA: tetratricopeptide repeat protein, partial [Nitrosopumilaceae archaeon]|nr:tetratricopeptide repeat protein [Nitrosopumilaceae archaeon]